MTNAEIEAKLEYLQQAMVCPSRPWIATSGCTDPNCTCPHTGGQS